MHSSVVDAAGSVLVTDVEEPNAGLGMAVVRILLCGVCGTDASHFRKGRSRPAIFGHEWVGEVVSVGDGVDSCRPGQRVLQAVPGLCGRCAFCAAGLPDQCQTVLDVATGRDERAATLGGFSELVCVTAERLMVVPDALSDEAAALIEPLAVVVHGLSSAPVRPAGSVVVQGAGPIGLLAGQVARALGAGTVVAVEPDARRRALALDVGFDAALAPEEAADGLREHVGELGADLAIECSGVARLVDVAAGMVRRGGHLVLLGYPHSPSEIDVGGWMRRELSVTGGIGYLRRDFEVALDLVGRGAVDVLSLHTATTGLDGLGVVLAALADGRSGDVKVLVDPRR